MAEITEIIPEYEGGDIVRPSDPAEFNTNINYLFFYHPQFATKVNLWTTQANGLRTEVNQAKSDTEGFKNTASTAAGTATTKAEEASDARDEAVAARNEVQTLYDNFDNRYLGSKSADPTLDNDGNPLLDGALYFNTISNLMKVYDLDTTTWLSLPAIYLSALLDVQLTSITTGDALKWNGSKWINFSIQDEFTPRTTGTTANRLPKYSDTNGTLSQSNLYSDAGGNLGLDTTPSLWHASIRAFETKAGAFLNYLTTKLSLIQNAYYSVGGIYFYKSTAPATMLEQENGEFKFYTAPSGTSETSVTFTERMKLDNDGRFYLNGYQHIPLSGVTAYHLLKGNIELSNTVITNGVGIYLYTGNTTTLPTVNLAMDIQSQHGDLPTEKHGYMIKIKSRNAVGGWSYVDSIRGITKYIDSSSTAVEGTDANMFTLSTVAGVTTVNIGTSTRTNTNGVTYVMEVYQTTHIKTGITNHGKAYTEHYNMVTGFTINGCAGSGLAGHEIPHSLGRKLGLRHIKNLTTINDWISEFDDNGYLKLNLPDVYNTIYKNSCSDTKYIINTNVSNWNATSNQYIMYAWANSYFDESGKLIGNFEIGTYQGGLAGNIVTIKGKPAKLMVKRLDSTGNWAITNNQTNTETQQLVINSTVAENDYLYDMKYENNGFILPNNNIEVNALGGQYLYFGIYDNDSGSGKSKYPKATDTSNIQVNNAIIPFAQGIDNNGTKVSTLSKNETITGLTYTTGKNYVYALENGAFGVKPFRPRYLRSDLVAERAGDNPDYFDVTTNTWFNTVASSELVVNGTFDVNTTGWTASSGCIISASNGSISLNRNSQPSNVVAYQNITNLVVGKKYKAYTYLSNGTMTQGTMDFIISNTDYSNSSLSNLAYSASGKATLEFTATATTMRLSLGQSSVNAGAVSYADNISVYATDLVVNTEIPSRNYLDTIAYADSNGQLTYIEELPKTQYFDRIETGSNRKVMYLSDYGISAIQVNKRYVLDNPFGNDRFMDCDTKLEVYDAGVSKWIEIGNSSTGAGSSTDWFGAKSFSTNNGIVIQTSLNYLLGGTGNTILIPESASTSLTSAPARVIIQFNGKTGRTR